MRIHEKLKISKFNLKASVQKILRQELYFLLSLVFQRAICTTLIQNLGIQILQNLDSNLGSQCLALVDLMIYQIKKDVWNGFESYIIQFCDKEIPNSFKKWSFLPQTQFVDCVT